MGKTTLLGELEARWAGRAVYATADVPSASLPGWWEVQWQKARALAAEQGRALLLLDEVQYLPNWSKLLKHEADRIRREHIPLHVVATGSWTFQLGSSGARESMAGRFELLRLLHWPAQELALRLGVAPHRAAAMVVGRGGYPGAVAFVGGIRFMSMYGNFKNLEGGHVARHGRQNAVTPREKFSRVGA